MAAPPVPAAEHVSGLAWPGFLGCLICFPALWCPIGVCEHCRRRQEGKHARKPSLQASRLLGWVWDNRDNYLAHYIANYGTRFFMEAWKRTSATSAVGPQRPNQRYCFSIRCVEVKRFSRSPPRRRLMSFAGSCFSTGSALGPYPSWGFRRMRWNKSFERPDGSAIGTSRPYELTSSSSREGQLSTGRRNCVAPIYRGRCLLHLILVHSLSISLFGRWGDHLLVPTCFGAGRRAQ